MSLYFKEFYASWQMQRLTADLPGQKIRNDRSINILFRVFQISKMYLVLIIEKAYNYIIKFR